MKRALLLLLLLIACSSVVAARGHVQGIAVYSQAVTTAGSNSTNKFTRVLLGATITAYCPSTSTTICTIFSDSAGSAKANPFTASSVDGSYSFYTDAQSVSIRFSNVSGVSAFTIPDIPVTAGDSVTTLACGGVNDTTLLSTANAAGGTIVIPNGIICASNTQTISAALIIQKGGLLKPITGQTVTLSGPQNPDDWQKFTNATSGLGTISFSGNYRLHELFPEWWGSVADNSTDNAPPVQAAFDAAKTTTLSASGSAGVPVTFGIGQYKFNSTVTYSAANNTSIVIRGQGYSTVFVAGGNITILKVDQGNSSTQGLTIRDINFFLNLKDAQAIDGGRDAIAGIIGQSALLEDLWVNNPSANGTKKLIVLGADTVTVSRVQISGTLTAGVVANTNVGLYFSHFASYRLKLYDLNIGQCHNGLATDNSYPDGGAFLLTGSTFVGDDIAINLGGVGGMTGSAQSNWVILGNHFESNLLCINLLGFSFNAPLKNVTIADNYATGIDTGYKWLVAQYVDGLALLRNRLRSGTSGDHGGVAVTLVSSIVNARSQGNQPFTAAFAPNMTIAGNSTASPFSGPVFTSAVLSTDQSSLDLLEAPQKHPVATLTYSATIATDASVTESAKVTVTNNSNFTLSSPTNAITAGQLLTYDILNSSGGAMGTITWGATFVMSAWTNPANGKRKTIMFRWDGTNWTQQGAASPDMP